MAFPYETLQDGYFYGLLWPKSITEALVTFLLTQKQIGHWQWNSSNGPAIMEAREFLNAMFHTDYNNLEVLGRVKKLRARYTLFNTMVTQSGVVWNRETNFIYATPQQWADWREVYPMARAYMTHGEPLYVELKALFSPDNSADDDPTEDDELIIIVDNDDDEKLPPNPFQIVHALPAVDFFDIPLPVQPTSPDPKVIWISYDDNNHSFHDYFDSDVDIDFSDDEMFATDLNIGGAVDEVVNPLPMLVTHSSDEDMYPTSTLPIPSASI